MSATAGWEDVLAGRARWCVVEGDCLEVMVAMPEKSVDHLITDSPYSERCHCAAAAAAAAARDLPDGSKRKVYASGSDGFGFDHITAAERSAVAAEAARLVRRWSLFFSDQDGVAFWMEAVEAAGLEHIRIGQWVKIGPTPQFTGDRPGQACEAIEIAHPAGRKRWNGGGRHALWCHPIAALEARKNDLGRPEHITPKPIGLMLDLVSDFTDPGEVVLDAFCGEGTTGVACLRLGRRCILIEKSPKYAALARERMEAEEQGLTLRDARAGQMSLLMVPTAKPPPRPALPQEPPTSEEEGEEWAARDLEARQQMGES